jgi:hypothetical protein
MNTISRNIHHKTRGNNNCNIKDQLLKYMSKLPIFLPRPDIRVFAFAKGKTFGSYIGLPRAQPHSTVAGVSSPSSFEAVLSLLFQAQPNTKTSSLIPPSRLYGSTTPRLPSRAPHLRPPLLHFEFSNSTIPHSIAPPRGASRAHAMEAEPPQRWAATYTKHVKQKRKAYHDGALLLYPASGRLVLLDDAGDTLESRFLRSSEEFSPGAALSFQAHLVNVGEPEDGPARYTSSSASASAGSRTSRRAGGARARPPSSERVFPMLVSRAFVNPSKSRGCGGGGGGDGEAAGSGGAEVLDSNFQGLRATCSTCVQQPADVHAVNELYALLFCRVDRAVHRPADSEGKEVPRWLCEACAGRPTCAAGKKHYAFDGCFLY